MEGEVKRRSERVRRTFPFWERSAECVKFVCCVSLPRHFACDSFLLQ